MVVSTKVRTKVKKREPFLKEETGHTREAPSLLTLEKSTLRKSRINRDLIGNTVNYTQRHLGAHPDEASN